MRYLPTGGRVMLAAIALLSVWALTGKATETPPATSPGRGTLIIGTFPNQYWIIDESSGKTIGTIPMTSGIPRRTTLSADHSRFYAIEGQMETVEILDIASRKTVDTFTLSHGTTKVRIRSLEPDPLNRFVMMVTKAVTKHTDRWEIGPTELVQFDLSTHSVARTVPWPNGEERQSANMQFSPDGKLMYLFSNEDILIYETDGFTQVDRWDLSQPIETGMGALDASSTDSTNDEPGHYTGIFTTEDPVAHRRIMGIGRVDLVGKSIDFYELGPATSLRFAMAPDRTRAYGLHQDIGRFEFWTFDLVGKRIVNRQPFAGRPRMSMKTSSNGRVIYIYNAGNTIDLYDAATYQYMRTIELEGDATSDLFVLPPAS